MKEDEEKLEGCDCTSCASCSGHCHETEEEMDEGILTFVDDNGNDVRFEILDVITMNEKEYLVVLPIDEQDEGVLILEIKQEDGEEVYDTVTDEKEAEEVFAKFQEEYGSLDDEEDDEE